MVQVLYMCSRPSQCIFVGLIIQLQLWPLVAISAPGHHTSNWYPEWRLWGGKHKHPRAIGAKRLTVSKASDQVAANKPKRQQKSLIRSEKLRRHAEAVRASVQGVRRPERLAVQKDTEFMEGPLRLHRSIEGPGPISKSKEADALTGTESVVMDGLGRLGKATVGVLTETESVVMNRFGQIKSQKGGLPGGEAEASHPVPAAVEANHPAAAMGGLREIEVRLPTGTPVQEPSTSEGYLYTVDALMTAARNALATVARGPAAPATTTGPPQTSPVLQAQTDEAAPAPTGKDSNPSQWRSPMGLFLVWGVPTGMVGIAVGVIVSHLLRLKQLGPEETQSRRVPNRRNRMMRNDFLVARTDGTGMVQGLWYNAQ